ncbi:hypothetical protein MPSEU_000059700 [Mayamaea pseudoterrestris]|nr:hypothetical protein MPSEU_000059700 [Mayamaea pseudoterrestris]
MIRASNTEHARLLQAAADGDLTLLKSVSKSLLHQARCTSGCSVLHYAAGNNHFKIIDYLICEQEFDVDIIATGRKAFGRTPLHYACRNGHLRAVKRLVTTHHADVDAYAKHKVSPLQLAVWRNHLSVCKYLVDDCNVDPLQKNEFDCGLIHWLASAPVERAGCDGANLIDTARWLARFCKYLHNEQHLWDDVPDCAGNFAADLATMANTPQHAQVAKYLRMHCSKQRVESCRILGLSLESAGDKVALQKAFRKAAKQCHPDRRRALVEQDGSIERNGPSSDEFHLVAKAYRHLANENGNGTQANPAHSLKLMLLHVSGKDDAQYEKHLQQHDDTCFKTRLIAVLMEYGTQGLDLSNVKKKWKQVWPDTCFPKPLNGKPMALSAYILKHAGDVVALRTDDKGCLRVHAKMIHQRLLLEQGDEEQAVQI